MYVYLNDVVQGFQARDFRDVYPTLTLTHTHTFRHSYTHKRSCYNSQAETSL